MLDEAVANLAAASANQERHVRELGSWRSLDELALEFDDSFAPFRQQARESTDGRSRALVALENALDAISGPENGQYWQPDALSWPEWENIRRLANAAKRA